MKRPFLTTLRGAAVCAFAACALGSAAAGGGCSLTTDFASLDSEKGPQPDGGDGATSADGAGGSDGGGTTDGAPSTEAGTEAGKSPCNGSHMFCADFDVGTYDKGFTGQLSNGGGALALDDLAFSPPHSVRATQPRRAAGLSGTQSSLSLGLPSPWRRVVVEADLFLTTPAWQSSDVNFALVHIGLYSPQNSGTVLFVTDAACFGTIEHLTEPQRSLPMDAMPYDRWVHLVVDFDPGGKIHYQIDGKPFDRTFAAVTAGPNPAMNVELGILDYNAPAPAVEVRWDNVTVDLP